MTLRDLCKALQRLLLKDRLPLTFYSLTPTCTIDSKLTNIGPMFSLPCTALALSDLVFDSRRLAVASWLQSRLTEGPSDQLYSLLLRFMSQE